MITEKAFTNVFTDMEISPWTSLEKGKYEVVFSSR